MSLDISGILQDWPYEPGKISVRRILGDDGRPRIQLRLDVGLLQMEVEGRPDGQRPHGFESLLEYHEDRLRSHRAEHGGDEGFHLESDDCEALRAESVMYYHRYLSAFALEDYPAVERDTARNLRVLDLCNRWAGTENDRLSLEQYRPYVLMMHHRAKGLRLMEAQDFAGAREAAREGLEAIRWFLEKYGQGKLFEVSGEAAVLEALLEEIDRSEPLDPLRSLERSLQQAVEEERYEEAARLRDELRRLRGQEGHP